MVKQCFVIGGAGFIGRRVVDVLLANGRQVSVVGRSAKPRCQLPLGVDYFSGDLGDRIFLSSVLQGANELIDLSYASVPKASFDDPVHDIVSFLPSAVTLFQVASELALEKMVVVSSGGVIYGDAISLPITEDHPLNPISPYGITKLTVEKYAFMYQRTKSLPVICVRPGNAYGERQRPFVGQGFIATAIASILQKKDIVIYGDIGTIRDYIYVEDVAEGIVAALEYGAPGSCYNIGTGIGLSNKDILDILFGFAKKQGLEPTLTIMPPRKFDVAVNVLSSAKLSFESGWTANVPIEQGIDRTWKWFCAQAGVDQGG